MADDQQHSIDRLRLANEDRLDQATLERLAEQLDQLRRGLATIAAALPNEAEPATIERVDDRDW